MNTSERKNAKRMKALKALAQRDPEALEIEKSRLLRAWTAEVWQRVGNRDLPAAGSLVQIAEQFGLGEDLQGELIKAVQKQLGGPAFISRSVARPRGTRPDLLAAWEERFGVPGRLTRRPEERTSD